MLKESTKNQWLVLYIFVNISAGILMYFKGELIGDLSGNSLFDNGVLLTSTLAVAASYFIVMGLLFVFCTRCFVKVDQFKCDEGKVSTTIGLILIFSQLAFFIFNQIEGVNVAGTRNTTSGGWVSYIWIFFPVDMLFFIYYGIYRDNKLFYANFLIWIFSNLSRGWFGIFIFIAFFEVARAIRAKTINYLKVGAVAIIVVIAYPFISAIKWFLRGSFKDDGFSGDLTLAFEILNISSLSDYFDVLLLSLTQLIGRLQTVSSLVEIRHHIDFIRSEFENGRFLPFWMEGLHGIIIERLLYDSKTMLAGVALTKYFDYQWIYDVGDWITNISFPAWLFIAPVLIPIFILYVVFLALLSYYLKQRISVNPAASDMLWLAWLMYLMPPWFNVFTTFIYSLFLFLLMKIFIELILLEGLRKIQPRKQGS